VSYMDVTPVEEGMPKYGLRVHGFVHERDDIPGIKEEVKKIVGELPVEFDVQFQMYPRFGHFDFR
ncbi:MAG: hypothetical protein ABFD12_05220, partial [Syntrophorhabdus sp.]